MGDDRILAQLFDRKIEKAAEEAGVDIIEVEKVGGRNGKILDYIDSGMVVRYEGRGMRIWYFPIKFWRNVAKVIEEESKIRVKRRDLENNEYFTIVINEGLAYWKLYVPTR